MPEPTVYLAALRTSTAELVRGLTDHPLSDADVTGPSLCEGWTRGHVLTHIARNADGISDTLAGALRGEVVERYPDGWDARNAAIAAGADRPFAELASDVRESGERLDRAFAAIAEADAWDRPTEHGDAAAEWALRRWREVEVHRIDLAAAYTPDQWPAQLITILLPDAAGSLAARIDGAVHVTVTADGSTVPEFVGREWTFGPGTPVDVRGPDWAVLAWLTGRPAAAGEALSAAPPLREWR